MTGDNQQGPKLISAGGNLWVIAWLAAGIVAAVVAVAAGPTASYFHGAYAVTRGPAAAAVTLPLLALVVLVPSTVAMVRLAQFFRNRSAVSESTTTIRVRPSLYVVRLVLASSLAVAIAFAARAYVTPLSDINELEFVGICSLAGLVPIIGAIYLAVRTATRKTS